MGKAHADFGMSLSHTNASFIFRFLHSLMFFLLDFLLLNI